MTHEADTLGPTERDRLLNEIAELNAQLAKEKSNLVYWKTLAESEHNLLKYLRDALNAGPP